jgi:glycerol-3-phosphate dehydrogenase (NAD(P)+)
MENSKKQISIIGAGAMGRAMAVLITENKKGKVRLWDREPQLIARIKKDSKTSKEIEFITNLPETVKNSDLILLAVPSFAVRDVCQRISGFSLPPILMISKGMEEETSLLPFQVVKEVLKKNDILHLSWSRFAEDIYKKIPTTEILASENESLSKNFCSLLGTKWLRISTSTDLLGVQLAGALKNIIVIGIGLAERKNSKIKEKLIEEGVQEMIKLGKIMGAEKDTFEGPAGRINLELSADSRSRNYCLGQALFEKDRAEIQRELKEKKITIEGLDTTWAIYRLTKKYGLKLPMVEEVYKVIYEGKNSKESAKNLINLVSP